MRSSPRNSGALGIPIAGARELLCLLNSNPKAGSSSLKTTTFAILPSIVLSFLAPQLPAETITGTVLDAAGNPIPGVDIDVDNLRGGGDPDIFNDGTDLNGVFTTTVLGAGVFDVIFSPPPPPGTTALPILLHDVLIIGTVDLGVISLPQGVAVAGTLVNEAGIPVPGVNLDVRVDGVNQIVKNDTTDLFGNFLIAVPLGQITLEFLTQGVFGQTLAPQRHQIQMSLDADMGAITLQQGFHVSGALTVSSGSPVPDIDIDVFDSVTGTKVFTPGDNTGLTGVFDVVVPAGQYDVEWCPQVILRLVAGDIEGVVVAADTALGVFTLIPGNILSGTVSYSDGVPAQGVDLEVALISGSSVVTCNDDTDVLGFYQTVLPSNAINIVYALPNSRLLERAYRSNIQIVSDQVLNVVLPDCKPCGADLNGVPAPGANLLEDALAEATITYGLGVAGSGGIIPKITFTGSQPSVFNNQFRLFVEEGLGGSLAFLAFAPNHSAVPFGTGFLLVEPFEPIFAIPLYLDGVPGIPGTGSAEFPSGPIPLSTLGTRFYSQFVIQDPGAPLGVSLSNAIRFRIRNSP